jgi:hypothetical protein
MDYRPPLRAHGPMDGKNFIAISYGPSFLIPVPRPTNLGVVKSKRQKGTKKREKL